MVFSESEEEEQLVRTGCGKWRCAKIGHFPLHNSASPLESKAALPFSASPEAQPFCRKVTTYITHYPLNNFSRAKTGQSHVNDKSI